MPSPSDPARIYSVPAGQRVYAVGDIHGRLDLLDRLLARIGVDAQGFDGDVVTVFVGDYVDRGSRSADVIDRLAAGPPDGMRWVLLRGNHDQVMLNILEGRRPLRETAATWLTLGGRETLRSYGMPTALMKGDDLPAMIADMRARVPEAHVDFLRRTGLSYRAGDYVFVHAGIRPGVPLEAQNDHDMMWIRDDFLASRDDHGVVVVHGHTPAEGVENLPNRIGIDTGAYATGRLSAVVLEGESRRFLA